jgi:hypothetical protein
MARIPSSCATSGTSSTSSLTKCAPGKSSENLFLGIVSKCWLEIELFGLCAVLEGGREEGGKGMGRT